MTERLKISGTNIDGVKTGERIDKPFPSLVGGEQIHLPDYIEITDSEDTVYQAHPSRVDKLKTK